MVSSQIFQNYLANVQVKQKTCQKCNFLYHPYIYIGIQSALKISSKFIHLCLADDFPQNLAKVPNFPQNLAKVPNFPQNLAKVPNFPQNLAKVPNLFQNLARFLNFVQHLADVPDWSHRPFFVPGVA